MSDLIASNAKGSARQLFGRDESLGTGDFFIRPTETRKRAGLALGMGDMLSFGDTTVCGEMIDRISCEDSSGDFCARFMIPQKPCILTGCTSHAEWPAGSNNWSPESLLLSLGAEFRFEIKDSNATVSLIDFVRYMDSQGAAEDDNPCYLWETLVDDVHNDLINKFNVPSQFQASSHGIHVLGDEENDLLSCAGEDGLLFGLHRWMLIGPKRSGSALHVDPLGTSAWNTLLLGTKLWCLFPPDTPESLLRHDVCASEWFSNILPTLSALRPQCFLQYEGETVYIPAKWHHSVINLTATVCVTQNFAEKRNYSNVCREVYDEEAIAGEEKDCWRQRLRASFETCSHMSHMITSLCVHCGEDALCNSVQLLQDRPVCTPCQAQRTEYSLISAAGAERMGVCLWRMSARDTPPFVIEGGVRMYLLSDIIKLGGLEPVEAAPINSKRERFSKDKGRRRR